MSRRIIFHIISAIILALVYYFLFGATSITQPIILAFIYVAFSILFDFILAKRNAKRNQTQMGAADQEKVRAFLEAVGGASNIRATDSEASRVKVEIKDVDLIDQDKLKDLALDGAYLAGDQLQVTIGMNSEDFSRQISEAIG